MSSAELLGHVHHAKASPLPFQHDRRRAADRATTPTSSSSKYIIDWADSGYISPLLQRIEGGCLAAGAVAATCGRKVRQGSMTSRLTSCASFPNGTQSMRSVEMRAERRARLVVSYTLQPQRGAAPKFVQRGVTVQKHSQ